MNTRTSVNWGFDIEKSWAPWKKLRFGGWVGFNILEPARHSITKTLAQIHYEPNKTYLILLARACVGYIAIDRGMNLSIGFNLLWLTWSLPNWFIAKATMKHVESKEEMSRASRQTPWKRTSVKFVALDPRPSPPTSLEVS
jgi:hypothetical protein